MPTSDTVHVARFKSKAKTLHKAVKAGNSAALTRVKPYFQNPATIKLSQAQLVVAREHNVKSWRQLTRKDDWANCSFCKKWQYDVKLLIAGPESLYVCNECVELCNDIIHSQQAG